MAKHCFVLLLCVHVTTISMVRWELKEPLIFGGNATLICYTNDSNISWMKNDDAIAHWGVSFYPMKYTVSEDNDQHSLLEIIDVTESDVNVTYTCLSGIHSFSDMLLLTEDNYIYPPLNGNIDVTWTTYEGTQWYATVIFGKIYPSPKCNLTYNGENLKSEIKVLAKIQQSIYYNITINVKATVNKDMCRGNISVICNLALSYLIHLDSQQEIPCEQVNTSSNTETTRNIIIAIAVPILLVLGFFFFLFACRKKKYLSEKSTRRNSYQQSNAIHGFCCGTNPSSTNSSNVSLHTISNQPGDVETSSSSNGSEHKPYTISTM